MSVIPVRCVRCGSRAVHQHHVTYAQAVRRTGGDLDDPANLLPVCFRCHERHHTRTEPFELGLLPDSAVEYAKELMGAGAAYVYLRRRYSGEDPRLEALVKED